MFDVFTVLVGEPAGVGPTIVPAGFTLPVHGAHLSFAESAHEKEEM